MLMAVSEFFTRAINPCGAFSPRNRAFSKCFRRRGDPYGDALVTAAKHGVTVC